MDGVSQRCPPNLFKCKYFPTHDDRAPFSRHSFSSVACPPLTLPVVDPELKPMVSRMLTIHNRHYPRHSGEHKPGVPIEKRSWCQPGERGVVVWKRGVPRGVSSLSWEKRFVPRPRLQDTVRGCVRTSIDKSKIEAGGKRDRVSSLKVVGQGPVEKGESPGRGGPLGAGGRWGCGGEA